MRMLAKLFLLSSAVALVGGVMLAFFDTNLIAGPNGWLDLSLVCAVFSIAIKFVLTPEEKTE